MTELLKAFLVGGLLCVIGQLLIDKTKLMSGRILVLPCNYQTSIALRAR